MKKNLFKNKVFRYIAIGAILMAVLAWWFFAGNQTGIKVARADYLKLTETSDYFHIQGSVYGLRIWKTNSDYYVKFYNASSTEIADGILELRTSDGTLYMATRDTNRAVSLIENSPSRIVIKIKGKFDSTYGSGSNYLTDGANDVEYTAYYYIYPKYFTYKININAYNGVSLMNIYYGSPLFRLKQNEGWFDSGQRYYGTSTGEVLASNYGIYESAEYGAVLSTSTVDWQVVKLSENHSGTSTFAFSFDTESSRQDIFALLNNGSLKGEASLSLAVRPWPDSTAAQRRAWAAAMRANDEPGLTVGAAVNDWAEEISAPFAADSAYHLSADNNKVKFSLHGEADAYALLAATTTGGAASLTISNNSGLADGAGAETHWAQIGERKPYGTFDPDDPDVLFYWDMDSAASNQAPNKGVGPIEIDTTHNIGTSTGVAKNAIRNNGYWGYFSIASNNILANKGSLGFWYKYGSSTDEYFFPIQHGNTWEESKVFRLAFFNYDSHAVFVINNSGASFYPTGVNLLDNNWHYIKISWDADNNLRKFYIDGKLEGSSSVSFIPPVFTDRFYFMLGDATFKDYQMDELYISSDPDQPDEPSYYDVISYTDVAAGELTGLPESGAGSLKWNYETGAPIVQTTKPEPVFVIHNWQAKTKSTTTGEFVSHLVLDLPLDEIGSNNNAGKVYDNVSGSWLGAVSAGVSFSQAVQGNGAQFEGGGQLEIAAADHNLRGDKGTIEFNFKKTSAPTDHATFFRLDTWNEFIFSRWSSDTNYRWRFNQTDIDFKNMPSIFDGQWHYLRLTWNTANNQFGLTIDQTATTTSATTSPMSPTNENLRLGSYAAGDSNGYLNGIIDNFRVYDDVILPYGAYWTGYEANGDYAHKQADVSFYWRLDDLTSGQSPQIGTGTITVAGPPELVTGIDGTASSAMQFATSSYAAYDVSNLGEKNAFSVWIKPNWDDTDTQTRLIIGNDSYNSFRFYKHSTAGRWYWSIRDDSGVYHYCYWNMDWSAGQWLHFYFWYDTTATSGEYNIGVKVNGVEPALTYYNGTGPITISSWSSQTGRIGGYNNDADCVIDEFYITSDPNTPEAPTAFGRPLLAPQVALVSDSGTDLKQRGTDYEAVMLNDITNWLVKYKTDVSAATTFLITETLNPPASAGASRSLDRPAPLLSTSWTSGYAEVTVQKGDGSYSDDFKLVFKEADAGVSECYRGQGAAGSWGSNLCGATDMLTEIAQNSIAQEGQTSVLTVVQTGGAEAVVRNYFTLATEATTTEDWHIFANGVVVKEIKYEKANSNTETRAINSNFTNWAYYPATPSVARAAGVYFDSLLIHLTSANTDIQADYQNPAAAATTTIGGWGADMGADYDADAFAEARGAYALTANYAPDPSVPVCPGVCGTPIYHTIGTSSAAITATATAISQISAGLWLARFASPLDLAGIHKHDKFSDSAGNDWNIVLVADDNDAVVVGNQEQNSGAPATGVGTLGPWYNSLASWESAENRDLTSTARYANGEIEMAECWPMLDTSEVFIYGWTTGKNNFIKVYTPLSARHHGKWTEDSYRLEVTATADYIKNIMIREDFVKIDGLQLKLTNNDYQYDQALYIDGNLYINPEAKIYISNNIIKAEANTSGDDYVVGIYSSPTNGTKYIWNNIIYGFNLDSTTDSAGIYSDGLDYIFNNTIYNCIKGIRGLGSHLAVLKNNLIASTTDPFNGIFASGTDYNATDINDTPGVGDHNLVNQAFSFQDAANNDFHLAADDTCAQGAGTNLSALVSVGSASFSGFSTDIDGEPRARDWDIGADQVRDKWLNKAKFSLDPALNNNQTIYQPRFLLNDFYPQTGKNSGVEDYILFYDPMDSIVDGHQPTIGSGTVSVIGTTSLKYAVRGRGLYLATTTDGEFRIDNSDLGISKTKGSASFYYIPNNTSEPENMNFVWFSIGGSGGQFYLYRRGESQGGNNNRLTLNYGLNSYTSASVLDWTPGQKYLFRIAWYDDGSNVYKWVWRDNDLVIQAVDNEHLNYLSDYTYIGNNSGLSAGANGTIDEFKIYSEPILPFGAYYTGYEQNGNYNSADPSLIFYWDAEKSGSNASNIPGAKTISLNSGAKLSADAALLGNFGLDCVNANGSASVPVSGTDIINGENGSVGMWVNIQTLPNDWTYFFGYGDSSNNQLLIGLNDQNHWRFYYTAGGINEVINAASGPGVGEWHYVRVTWNSHEKIHLYVDGQELGTPQDIAGTWQYSGGTIYLGADYQGTSGIDCWLDQIFITNSPYSAEIPTAFGKPLRPPLMKVDGVRQKYGYDYIVSWTPDPSAVIIQYFKNITSPSVFEIGAGEGTAQTIRLRGNIRLEGGVRF